MRVMGWKHEVKGGKTSAGEEKGEKEERFALCGHSCSQFFRATLPGFIRGWGGNEDNCKKEEEK